MSQTVKLRRSATPGNAPSTAQLSLGELAINTYDGKIFIKKDTGTESIVTFSPIDALGDLSNVSISSPTNGQVLTWNGSNWVNDDATGGGGSSSINDVISINSYTGDDSTTDYALPATPLADEEVLVTINGIVQHTSVYSISGSVLTFSSAPASGDNIELRVYQSVTTDVVLRDYASFLYQPTGDQTVFTGADDNGTTLEYDVGKLEVYLNGVRLVDTLDYTATDGSTVTLLTTVTSGDTVEIVSLAKAAISDPASGTLQSNSVSLTTTDADQTVDTFDIVAYRSAKYVLQMSHASLGYHVTEVMVIHDGTTAYINEYGTIYTSSSLGTVDATISGSDLNLTVTPANTNTTVSVKRISIGV